MLLFQPNDSYIDFELDLSSNKYIKLSTEFIEKYKNEWDWAKLSRNENLDWSFEIIEKFEDKWDWYALSFNKNLPWSIKLIHKYSNKIESNKNIWKNLKPFVDDEMVLELIKE